jgi:hypothetical protein
MSILKAVQPDMHEHFADHASLDVRQALKELAQYAAEQFEGYERTPGCCVGGAEVYGEPSLDLIYGKDPGGFIPCQLGGYSATQNIRFDVDASYHVSEGMTAEANRLYELAYADALAEFGLEADAEFTDEQNERLYKIEDEYFNDGALIEFECWLGGDPYPETEAEQALGEVFMRLSVNYKDGPYFRSKYAETLKEFSFSVDVLREVITRWPDDWQERLWRQMDAQPQGKA